GATAGAADTTITVNTAAAYNYYPTPPFIINVANNAGSDNETMSVTAISGSTFTVTRGVNGTSAVAHAAGENVGVPGDIFGAGPGITSIYLDRQGWLNSGRVLDLDNSACNQTTLDLVALNQNGIGGKFVARIPASIVINTPSSTTTTSDKYWLEYREATGWDA